MLGHIPKALQILADTSSILAPSSEARVPSSDARSS